MRGAIAVVLMALMATSALAGDVTELPGLSRQAFGLTVAPRGRDTRTLEALVVRPNGPGPFPLVLITHGMPRGPAGIAAERPQSYSSPAIAFAQHGYAAVIVVRSGYGHSTGSFAEGLGPCDDRHYVKAGQAAAADVLGAVSKLQAEPWVDPARVLLVGVSMGGFGVLAAAAANPAGVLGAISFAGAVGSPFADYVCQPDRLIEADRVFGQTTHLPSLWIFAQNDHYFAPALARRMFDAYGANGAPASLVMAPPYGREGHLLFFAPAEATWWPRVATFLQTLRLPTAIRVQLPPLPDLAEPAPLDDAARAAFAIYEPSRGYEKAFATDQAGHYGMAFGQRTKVNAEQAALKDCQQGVRVCSVYAVGNELAAANRASGR